VLAPPVVVDNRPTDANAARVARLIDAGKHAEALVLYNQIGNAVIASGPPNGSAAPRAHGRWKARVVRALGCYFTNRRDDALGTRGLYKVPPMAADSRKTKEPMPIPADTQKKIEEAMERLGASTSELRNVDYEKPLDVNDLLCMLHEIEKDARAAHELCWAAKVAEDRENDETVCPRCGSDSVGTVRTSGMSVRIDCGKCHYSGTSLA
jgi:ribosomal protein S27AE